MVLENDSTSSSANTCRHLSRINLPGNYFTTTGEKPTLHPFTDKATTSQTVNYRPVSLTSIISKLLEHFIHSQIMDHSDRHQNITSSSMASEQKFHRIATYTCIHDISFAFKEGNIAGPVSDIEFAKAFDKVPHERLSKMHYYGISP